MARQFVGSDDVNDHLGRESNHGRVDYEFMNHVCYYNSSLLGIDGYSAGIGSIEATYCMIGSLAIGKEL